MTVELGSVYCYQSSGTKSQLIEKKETFQYIPLIENLRAVVQNNDILRSANPLSSFCHLQFGSCVGKLRSQITSFATGKQHYN